MNIENMKTLLKAIENDPDFTMSRYSHTCGSPACACGWANYLAAGEKFTEFDNEYRAAHYMGAYSDDYTNLFSFFGAAFISKAHAIKVLRSWIKDGSFEKHWSTIPDFDGEANVEFP